MLVRRDEFRASKAMVHRVLNTHNIKVLYNTETKEIVGDGRSEYWCKAQHNNKTGEEKYWMYRVSLCGCRTSTPQYRDI